MAGISGAAVDQSNIHNLKDILETYNKITEACFAKCASNMNYRSMTDREVSCVDCCSGKFINANQRIMANFMEFQTKRQQAMIEDAEKKYKEEQAAQSLPPGGTMEQPLPQEGSIPQPEPEEKKGLSGIDMLFKAGQVQKGAQSTGDDSTSTEHVKPS